MDNTRRSPGGIACARYLVIATGILLGGGGAIAGCGSVETTPIPAKPAHEDLGPTVIGRNIDQIDLLLMIDNSRSMADKQQILAFAVPDLVRTLTNPICVDATYAPAPTQPTDPLSPCPPGSHREYTPVTDIHVGIITSSLGGHGADACSPSEPAVSCPNGNPSNNDAAHLITRQSACGASVVPTYEGKGFLAWDPAQKLSPPGEAHAGSIAVSGNGTTTTVAPGLIAELKDLVVGVGNIGCGYTSQLESWYRFLVDPEPYQTISVVNGKATPQGTDTQLLKERADFLRSGSLLAIVMLTDTNDCSIKESGQFYYAAQQKSLTSPGGNFHLPRARKECETNPEDPCCKSCGQAAPPNCPVDDACTASPTLSDAEDNLNLRCFDQKRRFGIDCLYGIDRYQAALQSKMIPDHQGAMVPNPIFSDLNPADDDTRVRDKGLVFLAGVVGVPGQDIARDPTNPAKGLLDANELRTPDGTGHTAWDKILGDPAAHVLPIDPRMIEAVTPRPGLPGPTAPPDADPIIGHERTIPEDDLQYACVFALPAPRDCSMPGVEGCECNVGNDNPLCDPNTKTLQVRAKAYPALRQLATLKSLSSQGIVASLCPVQTNDTTRDDYGYRMTLRSITDRLKTTVDGTCFPRTLTPDAQGQVSCTIIQARKVGQACSCESTHARRDVPAADQDFLDRVKASSVAKEYGMNCFCELVQAGAPVDSTPQDLAACVGDASEIPLIKGGNEDGAAAKGWCYVDPSQSPASNPEVVKNCPVDDKRLVRFTGDALVGTTSLLFMSCAVP